LNHDIYRKIIANIDIDKIVDFVTEFDIDITYDDNYLFRYACRYGLIDLVNWLIEHGVDINCCNHYGIKTVSYSGNIKLFHLLVNNGADVFCCHGICFVICDGIVQSYLSDEYPEFYNKMKTNHHFYMGTETMDINYWDALEKLIAKSLE
jgi:ankyrin repeat protein